MIGHAREADRAEEDRLELPELLEPVVGHHAADLRVALAAPVERGPLEAEAEAAAGRLEHAYAFWNDFLADPVPGDHGDPMCHLCL